MNSSGIGFSGLNVNQRLLDLLGQNIANANTPGYHRQVADLAVRTSGLELGTGVEIQQVRRLLNRNLESAILRHNAAEGTLTTQYDALRQVENYLDLGEGSVPDLMGQFFTQAEELSGRPQVTTLRRLLLDSAASLLDKFNVLAGELGAIRQETQQQLQTMVAQVNDLTGRIAELNGVIQRNSIQGTNINDLSDQRDQLISQLSELVDVRTLDQEFGRVNVFAAGVPLVLGIDSLKLEMSLDGDGLARLQTAGLNVALTPTGGSIHGALELHNQILEQVLAQFAGLAETFVRSVDGVQATGLPLGGGFQVLYGQRAVSALDVPLAQADPAFPVQAGVAAVSITDLATGRRELHQVAIDPATQTLQDVAAAFSAVPHLQGVAETQGGTLVLVAQPGYSLDFAGRPPSHAQVVVQAGTVVPQLDGLYSGAANDVFTFTVVGSGTVGVTPNLALEARNSQGDLIGTFNVGQGYEAGSPLGPLFGVRLRLGVGTVQNGDQFQAGMIAKADTAGLLVALGLNTMFTGHEIGTLGIRADLRDHPELIAASLSGEVGEGSNLRRLAALRDQPLIGQQTLSESFAGLAADVGRRIEDMGERQLAEQTLGERLEAERQHYSGVDPNEELVRLLQFQKAYQFNARFLASVNETYDELLRLV